MSPHHSPNNQHPLRVAVVGHSFMGKAHSNAWRNVSAFYPQVPPVQQQVLVGREGSGLTEHAEQYGWAETSTDWLATVERDDIDIVDICAPGQMHADIATAALQAGKHVLVEKPLANSLREGEAMASAALAAQQQGVRSMVGFNYRRVPALRLARDLIASGRIGQVRQMRVNYLQDWLVDEHAPMSWRLRRESAGSGVLGDLGSHAVDQVRALLGEEIRSAAGKLHTFVPQRPGNSGLEDVTVDDAIWAHLVTDSGAVVSLEASRMATGRKNALQIEVYGSRGSLAFDLERLNELTVYDATDDPITAGPRQVLVTEEEHPYLSAWWPAGHILGWDHTFTSQAADFLTAIAAGENPTASFADGLATQRVLAAIEDSSQHGGSAQEIGHEFAHANTPITKE